MLLLMQSSGISGIDQEMLFTAMRAAWLGS
jgi:hypothetical protein